MLVEYLRCQGRQFSELVIRHWIFISRGPTLCHQLRNNLDVELLGSCHLASPSHPPAAIYHSPHCSPDRTQGSYRHESHGVFLGCMFTPAQICMWSEAWLPFWVCTCFLSFYVCFGFFFGVCHTCPGSVLGSRVYSWHCWRDDMGARDKTGVGHKQAPPTCCVVSPAIVLF